MRAMPPGGMWKALPRLGIDQGDLSLAESQAGLDRLGETPSLRLANLESVLDHGDDGG